MILPITEARGTPMDPFNRRKIETPFPDAPPLQPVKGHCPIPVSKLCQVPVFMRDHFVIKKQTGPELEEPLGEGGRRKRRGRRERGKEEGRGKEWRRREEGKFHCS